MSTSRARMGRVLLAVGALVLIALSLPPSVVAAAADDAPSFSVTVTPPPVDVVDGQRLVVSFRSPGYRPAPNAYDQVAAGICRPGVAYVKYTDFEVSAGNCPSEGLRSSDPGIPTGKRFAQLDPARVTGDGQNLTIFATAGDAEFGFVQDENGRNRVNPDGSPMRYRLQCGPTAPCLLVVRFTVRGTPGAGEPDRIEYFTTPITYRETDPNRACGGTARGAITAGFPDGLLKPAGAWSVAACQRPGATPGRGVLSTLSLGEDQSLRTFADGAGNRGPAAPGDDGPQAWDLTYSAYGYAPQAGWAPPNPRPVVPVPTALNASVLALAGGRRNADGTISRLEGVRFTADEVARIYAQGSGSLPPVERQRILDRNPELADVGSAFLRFFGSDYYAPGSAASSTLTMSAYFDANHRSQWVAQDGTPRGVVGATGTATPGWDSVVERMNAKSGLAALGTAVVNADAATSQPGFNGMPTLFFTDLLTARALGLSTAAIQFTPNGPFVAPTETSLRAAVPTLKATDDGTLVPDPTAIPQPAGDGTAYPLTYVEQAMAPAEPLVDLGDGPNRCAPRPDSQAYLSDWLAFTTGPGQGLLPAGTALPDDLREKAAAAIARVGASPVTGPCAGSPNLPAALGGTGTPVASLTGGFGLGTGGFGGTGGGAIDAAPVGPGDGAPKTDATEPPATRPGDEQLPEFAGSSWPSAATTALVLIALAALTILPAFVTSRRAAPATGGGDAGDDPASLDPVIEHAVIELP